jgi:hypothetical protein
MVVWEVFGISAEVEIDHFVLARSRRRSCTYMEILG